MNIGEIWNLIILSPTINVLIVMSNYLLHNFGLAIIALTIVVNLCLFPLTLKQLKSTQAMQSLQPKLAELQKKYAKDRQKLAQEQMKLYRESGMNPAGCLVPMLIQMPVWIALFQTIIRLLAVVPEDFLGLSQHLYSSWSVVFSVVPLGKEFLWLNLAKADTLLAILVGATMWLQQKMTMPPTTDPRQQTQSRMMLWMMPMMFTLISLSFPSGLALFWVTSSIVRIALQYYLTGWGNLLPGKAGKVVERDKKYKKKIARVEAGDLDKADIGADIVEPASTQEGGPDYGTSGDIREDRGGGYTPSYKSIRRQSGRGRSHRRKRR